MIAKFSTLGDVAEFINGAAFKPEDWGEEGLKIIRIQNLNDPTKPYNKSTRKIAEKLYVQPGDLLVSWSASLGVFEWTGPDVGLLNQHIFRVLPNEQKVDKRFLKYALKLALLDMQKHLHGATMMHINRSEFLATKFYLPPLPEQRRIAAILDQADTLRAKRREALAQLDNLTQSIFIEMFGDPSTNPKGWCTIELAKLIVNGDTINYGVVQPGEDLELGVPLIRVGDIVDGRVSMNSLKKISPLIERDYKRSRLVGDEILVSCVGSIGVVALATPSLKGFNIARAVARVRLSDKADKEFIAAHLKTESVQRYFTQELRTVSQPTLNIKQLSETKIMNPPIEMQRLFAARCAKFNEVKLLLESSKMELDNLFSSLQHRGFQGEL